MPIFDLFLTRDKEAPDVFQYEELPEEFRNQVIWIWKESVFRATSPGFGYREKATNELMQKVHTAICTELGRMALVDGRVPPEEDLLAAFS